MRYLILAASVLVAAQAAAQGGGSMPGMPGMADSDPTRVVAGSGRLPAGLMGRVDTATRAGQPQMTMAAVKVEAVPNGFDVTGGPASIIYNAKDMVTMPNFTLKVTMTQKQPTASHGEAYGVFFGGSNLQMPTQDYAYFLIRIERGGEVYVAQRDGMTVTPVGGAWKANPAVKVLDATGKTSNDLMVAASADSVRMSVNGKQVAAFPRSAFLTLMGQAGVRVNHNLDVRVENFTLTQSR